MGVGGLVREGVVVWDVQGGVWVEGLWKCEEVWDASM